MFGPRNVWLWGFMKQNLYLYFKKNDVIETQNHDNDSYSYTNKYDNDDIVCLDHEMLWVFMKENLHL